MKNKMKRYGIVAVFISASLILAWYFYKIVTYGADECASYATYFAADMFGYAAVVSKTFEGILLKIVYSMFGMTTLTYSIWYAIWFFLCCACTLYISVKKYERYNLYLVPVFMYIMIPYVGSNRYHLAPACITLLYYVIIQMLNNHEKKLSKSFWLFTVLYLFIALKYTNDYVLVGVFLILPICIYVFFMFIDIKCKKQGKMVFLLVTGIVAVSLRVFDEIVETMTGKGFFATFGGYGGADYTSWSDPYIIASTGLPAFINSMLKAWNIPIEGGFLQLQSLSWCIRLVLLGFAWVGVVRSLVKIFKGGISEISPVESMATFSVLTASFINIVNGTVTWGGELAGRYASVVWFLLVAFAMWEIEREVSKLKENRINCFCLALAGVLLFVSYGVPFFLSKDHFVSNEYEEQISYLEDNNLEYGLGSFEAVSRITFLSGGKSQAMWVNMDDEGYISKGVGSTPQFNELKNNYNYFYEDLDNQFCGVTEKRIVKNWGEYVEKQSFYKLDEQVHSNIYVYDYDIRWKPIVVKNPNDEIEVTIPLGKTRVVVEGDNLSEAELKCNADCEIVLMDAGDDKLVYEIESDMNRDVLLQIIRQNENSSVSKMTYYVVNAYKDVYLKGMDTGQNEIEFSVPKGEYFIYIEGDNIKKESYTVIDKAGDSLILDNQIGKAQQRIKVNLEEDTVITISGDNMGKISRVTYTDAYESIPEELIMVGIDENEE